MTPMSAAVAFSAATWSGSLREDRSLICSLHV
jgi:hypothetical protein